MAETARVGSIDAIKSFKIALWKFAEAANTALGDAEGEMTRTLQWVENEQSSYWASELRKRHTLVERCKEAVRMKKLFKDSTGGRQSVVDEEKALARALKLEEEAVQKIAVVKSWTRKLQKEILLYKGHVQRFATSLSSELPVAAAQLEQMIGSLESYVGLAPSEVRSEGALPAGVTAGGMARGEAPEASKLTEPDKAPQATGRAFAALRTRSPDESVRRKVPPGDIAGSLWHVAAMSLFDRELFEKIDLPLSDPNVELLLVVADRAWESPRIYLERLEPYGERDTGWYLGPATEAPKPEEEGAWAEAIHAGEEPAREQSPQPALQEAYHAVRVSDLLAVRPDLRDILRLPVGCLAVLDVGGVAAILDPRDHDVWDETSKHELKDEPNEGK